MKPKFENNLQLDKTKAPVQMNKNGSWVIPNWSQEEQRGKTVAKTTGDGSKVEKKNGGRGDPHGSQYEN